MDEEEIPIPVLAGYLTIKSQNGFSIKNSKKPKFCQLFKASRNGIERLEISDSELDKNLRIVTLENCVKIVIDHAPSNIINIVTKTGQIQLISSSEASAKQWKVALQSVAFKEKHSQTENSNQSSSIEEDNDLYCSSYNDIFTTTLIPTDASLKCGLECRMYTLMLTSTEIQLKCYENESITVASWPYRFIRKYGYRDGKFTFEAGRKCDTGEGTFKLDNANPQEIFRCMSSKMKSMKKSMTGESFNKRTPNLQNQFNATFCMEPGSRSPLPPATQNQFMHLENQFRVIVPSLDLVCPPNKPPRKVTTNVQLQKFPKNPEHRTCVSTSNVSSVFIQSNHSNREKMNEFSDEVPFKNDREYESVENITDAWRKLGIDDIKHTESSSLMTDNTLLEFPVESLNITCATHIVNNYDKLDHFRSSRKSTTGYKTIVPIKQQDLAMLGGSSDDYEIIGDPLTSMYAHKSHDISDIVSSDHIKPESPDKLGCRVADDSYQGYGIIRKSCINNQTSTAACLNTNVNIQSEHDTKNNYQQEYATVSKPKHV